MSNASIMSKIGVAPMKIIKGETGLYFKFADGCGSNSSPIELYFKPKFVRAPYEVEAGTAVEIVWMEINILWVGPPEFQEFEHGWKVFRDGKYSTEEGKTFKGYLLGKMLLPMGEFNGSLQAMHTYLDMLADVEFKY